MQRCRLWKAKVSLAQDRPDRDGKQPRDVHSMIDWWMLIDMSRTSAAGQALSSSRKCGDCCTQLSAVS